MRNKKIDTTNITGGNAVTEMRPSGNSKATRLFTIMAAFTVIAFAVVMGFWVYSSKNMCRDDPNIDHSGHNPQHCYYAGLDKETLAHTIITIIDCVNERGDPVKDGNGIWQYRVYDSQTRLNTNREGTAVAVVYNPTTLPDDYLYGDNGYGSFSEFYMNSDSGLIRIQKTLVFDSAKLAEYKESQRSYDSDTADSKRMASNVVVKSEDATATLRTSAKEVFSDPSYTGAANVGIGKNDDDGPGPAQPKRPTYQSL